MDDEQLAKIGIKRSGIRDHAEHLVTYRYDGLERMICVLKCQTHAFCHTTGTMWLISRLGANGMWSGEVGRILAW
jgi:hypothetical protein